MASEIVYLMNNLKQKTIGALIWNLGGVGGRQGIQLVIGVVLARLLSPAEFGLMAMLMVFVAVSQVFVEGGFSAALVHKKDATREEESSVLFCNLGVSWLFYAILWFAAPYVASFYGELLLTKLLRFVGLVLPFSAPGIVQSSLLSRELNFKKRTQVTMLAGLGSGLTAVFLAWRGFGVWSLASQMVLNAGLTSLFFWMVSAWRPVWRFKFSAVKPLAVYGARLVGSTVLARIFENINQVLIGKFYTKTDLGYYSRALTLQRLPVNTFSEAIGAVILPSFVHMNDQPDTFRRGYSRALTCSMAVSLPMMILMLVMAEPLLRFLLGLKWMPAVPYFQIFCLSGIWYPMHLLNLNILLAMGRSDLYLRLEVIKKIITLSVTLMVLPHGVLALAWGMVGSGMICLYVNSFYAGRLAGYGLLTQLRDVVPYAAITAVSGMCAWLVMGLLPQIDIVRIGGCGVVFLAIMLIFVLTKKDNIYRYVWDNFADVIARKKQR